MEEAAEVPGPEAGGEQHPVGLPGETQVDSSSLHASQPGGAVESSMGDLEWKDYEELYEKWKAGAVADDDVRDIGGGNLLDLMEAQYILDIDANPPSQARTPGDTVQLVKGKFEGSPDE